jgi:hypothetical protein
MRNAILSRLLILHSGINAPGLSFVLHYNVNVACLAQLITTLAAATAQRTRLATSLPTHSPTLRNNRRELPCLPPRNACGFKPSAHRLTACSRLTVLTSCFPSARPYPRIQARPLIPVPDMWREGGSASQPGCRAPPTIAAVGRSVPWHMCASPPNGAIRYLETATIAP